MHRGSSRYRGGEGDLLESGIGPRESATQAFRRFPPTRNNSRWLASGCRLTSSRPHRRVWIRTRCKPRFAFGNNVPETLCPIRLCFHVSRNATSLRPSLVFAKRSNLSPQCLLARPALSLYYWTIHGGLQIAHGLSSSSLPSFPGNGINFAGQFPPAKYAFRYPRIVRKLQVGRLISESLINCCLLCVETLCLRQSVRSLNFYYSILFIRLSFSEVKLLWKRMHDFLINVTRKKLNYS